MTSNSVKMLPIVNNKPSRKKKRKEEYDHESLKFLLSVKTSAIKAIIIFVNNVYFYV